MMTPQLRLKMLTDYPEWHYKPLRLNRAEISNPYSVLEDFFSKYDLTNIRASLKQWLDDSFCESDSDAAHHFYTYEDTEKLVEAVWIIMEARRCDKRIIDSVVTVTVSDENIISDSNKEGSLKRFLKQPRLTASPLVDPVETMKQAFRIIELGELKEVVAQWLNTALVSENGNYHEAGQRADLLDFYYGLNKLLDISYALYRQAEWDKEGRLKSRLRETYKYALFVEEHSFALSEDDVAYPQKILADFFKLFSLKYARVELWEMLETVVASEKEQLNKKYLLLQYECLIALLYAAWLMHSKNEKQNVIVDNDKNESDL